MSIKKIWGTRTKTNAETHIGEKGSLFYDEATGVLRLSDGHTPGGVPVTINAISIVTDNLLPGSDNIYGIGSELLRWNHIHLGDGGVYFDGAHSTPQTTAYLPGAIATSLVPAPTNSSLDLGSTTHRWGNVWIGPHSLHMQDQTTLADIALTVDNGTLYLNGAQNLRVGNLTIVDTTLTSATNNLDISIGATDDTGYFYVKRKAQFDNTTWGSTEAMVSINGSGTSDPLTVFPDTLVQATGRPNKNSRIVQRAYGSTGTVGADNSYAVWASYAARGSVASPAALKTNDILARFSANGYGTTTWGNGGARVEFVALENFTDSAKGTKINFYTTPVGQITSQNVASVTSTGISAAAITFTGDSTTQTTAGIPLTQKKIANAPYVATLDNTGKLDATQIPDVLTGAIVFKGTWNATTNTPELSDSLPAGLDIGWEYIVDVPGTRDIGDGSKSFLAGDFVIFDGTHWKQVPSGNAFVSLTSGGHITVNQSTGAMTLGSDATPNSTVSTIVSRDSSGNFAANVITASLSGNVTGNVTGNVSGNAGTVTNGVYTSGSYANPSWITSLDYSKLSGSVPTVSSSVYLGTTNVAFNRASGSLSLAGVSIDGNAGTVTNGVYTNGSYSDPSWLTISKSKVGLSNVDNTADANKNVLYAATAGAAPASDVYAWAKAATKPTYTKSEVGLSAVENTALSTWAGSSSITTVGTLGSLSVTATITGSISGNAGTVTNGVYTSGSYSDPSWLTISKSKVGLSAVENTALSTSIHYIGTTSIQYNRASGAQTLTGVSIDGNAATVTNGVVTTGSYSDPSWLTISKSKVGLSAVENTALSTSTHYVGTTSIQYNRASAAQSLTGVSIDGSAGSVAAANITGTTLASNVVTSSLTTVGTLTNLAIAASGTITTPRVVINDGGLRTVSGGTTCTIDFATDSIILWTAPSGTAAITLQNYTAGAQVKLIIAMTTSRDVTYGISSAANSSDGADNFNGSGGGAISIANTAMHLEYTCITAVASGCYVKVTVN
jgi:hypothetical protein